MAAAYIKRSPYTSHSFFNKRNTESVSEHQKNISFVYTYLKWFTSIYEYSTMCIYLLEYQIIPRRINSQQFYDDVWKTLSSVYTCPHLNMSVRCCQMEKCFYIIHLCQRFVKLPRRSKISCSKGILIVRYMAGCFWQCNYEVFDVDTLRKVHF